MQTIDRDSAAQWVSRQCERWREIEPSATPPRPGHPHPHFGPYLALSAEHGCGVGVLGELLATRLGWSLATPGILDAVSHDPDLHQELMDSLDPAQRYQVAIYLASLPVRNRLATVPDFRNRITTIAALGRHGQMVLVGKGAHMVLPKAAGVRIRLVGTVEHRAQALAEDTGLSLAAATFAVRDEDRAAHLFMEENFAVDERDSAEYDQVFHVPEATPAAIIDTVLNLLSAKLGVKPDRGLTTGRQESALLNPWPAHHP